MCLSNATCTATLHHGNLKGAKTQIASAYLLDDRCLKCWVSGSPIPRSDLLILEYGLLDKINDDDEEDTFADGIMKVVLTFSEFSRMAGQSQELFYIQDATQRLDALVRTLERNPQLEGDGVNDESGPLGGLLRRCRLLEINARDAERSLTAALDATPSYYEARFLPASL
jgi:hypothetical protein